MNVFAHIYIWTWASLMARSVKNPPTLAGDMDSIPGLGESPGGGHSNPFQNSCLENSIDRGAWRAEVHGVTKSQTQLSMCTCVCAHTHTYIYILYIYIYIYIYINFTI